MDRFIRHSLFALAAALVSISGPAVAGIDKVFEKPGEKSTWGSMLEWALGTEGFGKSYALVIGISDYVGGFEPLRATRNDPIRMKDFLLDEAGFDHVHVLTDDKATKRRIAELLEDELPELIKSNDRFLFYWSGHGTQTLDALEKPLGFLPLANSGRRQFSSMISMDDLTRWDRRIAAKHALFLLDACFSGLAGSEAKSTLQDFTITRLSKPAHHLITAGTEEEQTIAHSRWKGSLFTDTIIKAARGAADAQTKFPRDGVVNLAELKAYARQRIHHERVQAGWDETITPQWNHLRSNQGEFFFVTLAKKLEVARVNKSAAIKHGLPAIALGPSESSSDNFQCDPAADRLFWETVKDEKDAAYFEAYLDMVESGLLCGLFEKLAKIALEKLSPTPEEENQEESWPHLEMKDAQVPKDTRNVTEVPLSRKRLAQVQKMLSDLGFDPGPVDGIFGQRTLSALSAFQKSIGVPESDRITADDEIALLQAYIDQWQRPELELAIEARARELKFAELERKRQGIAALEPAVTPRSNEAELKLYEKKIEEMEALNNRVGNNSGEHDPVSIFRDCPDCPEMVVIPAGTFQMGSPEDEEGRGSNEGPQHRVTIGAPFALGKYEVTFDQWDACVNAGGCSHRPKDEGLGRGNHPVINVNWDDAQEYVEWLSDKTGDSYRLPSEAEWEYAARAGTTTPFWMGATISTSEANYDGEYVYGNGQQGEYREKPLTVGSFSANPFGLLDVHGNVWEWVEDHWHASYQGAPTNAKPWLSDNDSRRVLRGGSWYIKPTHLRSAVRIGYQPHLRFSGVGFRVAKTLTP